MGDIYIYMLVILCLLAIIDLIVGVSNDAVNFLTNAIGSKAVSFKTIIIIASIGVLLGAVSSSGMIEVARKGVFNPELFYFNEVIIIFMSVMIVDVLLLDFFNSRGLPTSTTISVIFELLGAAFCMAMIKIYAQDDASTLLNDISDYILIDNAVQFITIGVVLAVFIAFNIGALVQFITRLMLSFDYIKRPAYLSGFFGGLSLTSLFYFILVNGLIGADIPFISYYIDQLNGYYVISLSMLFWMLYSYVYVYILQWDIYKFIIIVGTFSLAMAFAGNDLVNFIGVPVGAYQAWRLWSYSGIESTQYTMQLLSDELPTQKWILLVAGLVMVITLWVSTRAQRVVKTSIDLARQDIGTERFKSNALARIILRYSVYTTTYMLRLVPNRILTFIDSRYYKLPEPTLLPRHADRPSFDTVRASVNLMVTSVLIAIGTSWQLPLSTTYITFMVAMGTSLADRAWGADSAVYRISGVLNVMAGWLITALSAFVLAALLVVIMYYGGIPAFIILIIITIIQLLRSYIKHKHKLKKANLADQLKKSEINTIQDIIAHSTHNVAQVYKRSNRIYSKSLNALFIQDINTLRQSHKETNKLAADISKLRDEVYTIISGINNEQMAASKFYIEILGDLQDVSQSLNHISKSAKWHIDNNHKRLKFIQIKDLKEISDTSQKLFINSQYLFENKQFSQLAPLIHHKTQLITQIDLKINKQITRSDQADNLPKNTTLYFNLLLESRDLINALHNIAQRYYTQYDIDRFDN